MSCYHPMVAEWKGEYTASGKKKYVFVGTALDPRYKDLNQDMIYLPCGHCIGCRLDYSRKWADRMVLELQTMKKAVFVTLTYAEMPSMCSLNKKDHQNFMKEIRRQFKDTKIRFFMSGEYGSQFHRPHMHYIIYGLSLDDFPDKIVSGRNELGQLYYRSPFFESKIWKFGRVCISEVSWETCAYVARYTLKKLEHSDFDPVALGIQPEFSLMSRNPGIGAEYFKLHPDCLESSTIFVPSLKGALHLSVPQYYLRFAENQSGADPEYFSNLRQRRKKFAEDKSLLKLFGYDKRYDELLRDEEYVHLNRTQSIRSGRSDL